MRETEEYISYSEADTVKIGKTLAASLFDMYRLGDDNELPIRHLIKLCELYNVSADYILGLKRKQD